MVENETVMSKLSPNQQKVNTIVRHMEIAFSTGSVSRVLTSMTSHAPYASDVNFLKESMFNMPTLGWSCWEMSVMLSHFLNRGGIVDSGITMAFGAEENAPAVPHSMVCITDTDGTVFYADPYFGISILGLSNDNVRRWNSDSVKAKIFTPARHGKTPIIKVRHRSHPRDYQYHILPGTLSPEQLNGALWQAELFMNSRQYVRLANPKFLEIIKQDAAGSDKDSTSVRWVYEDKMEGPIITKGDWYGLLNSAILSTEADREISLNYLKSI